MLSRGVGTAVANGRGGLCNRQQAIRPLGSFPGPLVEDAVLLYRLEDGEPSVRS